MKYVPEGSYAGAAVSAVSIVAFAMIQTIRRRRKPSAEPREA